MKKIKVAICEWSLPIKGPSMFAYAKRLGLDGIQIDDWSSWEHGFPMADKEIQKLYLNEASKNNMSIPSMGCNGFSRLGGFVNNVNTPEGQNSIAALIKTKEICEAMKIPLAMFPCCWTGYIKNDEDLENAGKMLKKVCHLYDDSPVDIAIESVLTPEQYKDLLSFVGSKSLKIYYDTQNPQYFCGIFPPSEIEQIHITDIAEIHFKEGLIKSQGCLHFGDGETGFDEMVVLLKKREYQGWFVIENFYMKPSWQVKNETVWQSITEDVLRLRNSFEISGE